MPGPVRIMSDKRRIIAGEAGIQSVEPANTIRPPPKDDKGDFKITALYLFECKMGF
jgi:hypothetical protein